MVNYHRVKLVGVSTFNYRVFKSRQQWVHRLWILRRLMLVPIYFFVGKLAIQVVLVEGESKGELDIVRQLTLKLVKAFHLNHKNAWN